MIRTLVSIAKNHRIRYNPIFDSCKKKKLEECCKQAFLELRLCATHGTSLDGESSFLGYVIISRHQYHLFHRLMLAVHANRTVNIKLDTAFLKGGIQQCG